MGAHKGSSSNQELSRLTIDIPKKLHKRLKAMAAFSGKSMREYINELLAKELYSEKKPNKETLDVIDSIEKGENLVEADDAEDLFKKLGL